MNKKNSIPNYKLIYTDILNIKYPHKIKECESLLNKEVLSMLDILKINKIIFGKSSISKNQRFRSYSETDILYILNFQKINCLNNTKMSKHFCISRNTIAKWKKQYYI